MSKRIEPIDGLRGIAILLVVFFHYFTRWAPSSGQGLYAYGDAFADIPLLSDGAVGVYLFFIISGFVILQSLQRSKSIGEFAIRRVDRLFLPMVAMSLLTFIVLLRLPTRYFNVELVNFLPSWTFTSPKLWRWLNSDIQYIDGVYWTLFIEVRFYAILAVLWFFTWRKKITMTTTVLALVAVVAMILLQCQKPALTILQMLLFPEYIALFAAGTVYADVFNTGLTRTSSLKLVLLIPASCLGISFGLRAESGLFATILWLLAFHLTFFGVALHWRITQVFAWKPLVTIGLFSYSLYLIHQRVGVAILHRLPTDWSSTTYFIAVVGVFGVMCLIAYGSWRLIEEQRPFSNAVRSFSGTRNRV